MKQAILFPQMLKTHRQVMMSSIAKQCCILGHNSCYEQNRVVKPESMENFPELHGRNILLGLMDWNLYTHEDGCVISESLAKKLEVRRISPSCFIINEGKFEVLLKEGFKVQPRTIAVIHNEKPLRLKNKVNGIVKSVNVYQEYYKDKLITKIRIEIECIYPCTVGSKLSNLHSCKSIVSKILEDESMPCMASGEKIDMMISPMSVGNRVNPSLLMEGMLGMYCRESKQVLKIKQFDKQWTFEKAASLLESVSLPRDCMFRLRNGSFGEMFNNRTFVGYLFLMRLHHHAEDKLRWRKNVALDTSGLPCKGKGNVKYGREELEILYQYGSNGIMQEIAENTRKTSLGQMTAGLLRMIGYDVKN